MGKKPKHVSTSMGRDWRSQTTLQMMVLPAAIVVILFSYLPMYGVIIAFKNYDIFKGIMESPWARNNGLEHFIDFFSAPQAGSVIWNTIYMAFLKLAFCMFPPMILAILLNEVRNVGFMKSVQTMSYLPHFISWAVAGGIFYNLLNPSRGAINTLLMQWGVIDKGIEFISSEQYFRPLIVLTQIWKTIGWSSIIYLGVIVSIDQELYEAVEIDGGKRLAKIRYVTWPFLKPTFAILFIMECGKIMSGGDTFDQVYVFGNTQNRAVADILDTFILRVGLEQGRYSYATAANLFKSVINVILLITANKISGRLTEQSLF